MGRAAGSGSFAIDLIQSRLDRRDPRVRELAPGADQWRLLLQMDTDDCLDMMWEYGGLLYFWIREQDATKGDFSKVWLFLQSG